MGKGREGKRKRAERWNVFEGNHGQTARTVYRAHNQFFTISRDYGITDKLVILHILVFNE